MSMYELIPLLAQGAPAAEQGGNDPLGMLAGSVFLLALLGLWLAKKAGLVGAAVWFEVTYPVMNARILRLSLQRPWKCGLLGLLNLVIGAILVLVLLATRIFGLVGIALAVCIGALALMGFAGAYLGLGRRLAGDEGTGSGPRAVLLGGITAEAAFMLPVVGQVAAVLVLLRGFGAACLALLEARRERKQAAATPPASTEPPGAH